MKKHIYEIDENGFFLCDAIVINNEYPEHYVDTPLKSGFYKPRWNGTKWIEGATQEEIDELTKPQLISPSREDFLLDLDFRLSSIEIGL